MRNIFITLLLLFSISLLAQTDEQKTWFTWVITGGSINGNDISDMVNEEQTTMTIFQNEGSEILNFVIYSIKSDKQMFGPITEIDRVMEDETATTNATATLNFKWQFKSKDTEDIGKANANIKSTIKKNGTTAEIKLAIGNDIYRYDALLVEDKVTLIKRGKERMRTDYSLVSYYDKSLDKWSEWSDALNTFVYNYNSNGDIAHFKPSGEMILLRKISQIKTDRIEEKNEDFITMDVLDEDGTTCTIQIFNNDEFGVKIVYADVMLQFAKK